MEIFVGNLPFDITEQEIRDVFAKYGAISNIKMLTDKFTGRFRGIAFVTIDDDASAQKAIEEMNGADLGGRPMRLDRTRPREERFSGFGGGFRKPFRRPYAPRRDFGGQNEGGEGSEGGERPEGGYRQGGYEKPFNRGGFNRGGFNRGGYREGGHRDGGYRDGGFKRGGFKPRRSYDDNSYDSNDPSFE